MLLTTFVRTPHEQLQTQFTACLTSCSISCPCTLESLQRPVPARRASDFIVALLHRLHDDAQVSLSTAASDAYYKTLYNNHTWYTSAAFVVVLKVGLLAGPLPSSPTHASEITDTPPPFAKGRHCAA